MSIFRNAVLIFLLALTSFWAAAQSDTLSTNVPSMDQSPKKPFKDRIFVGGNAALSFGTVTYVGLSPQVGYELTDKWVAGVGSSYYYYSSSYYNYKTSLYGGSLFSRYMLWKGLFVEGDFEENNLPVYALLQTGDLAIQRDWIPSLLLGGGYAQSIGGRAGFFISILYDVIQNPNSMYYRIPVIRGGIGFSI